MSDFTPQPGEGPAAFDPVDPGSDEALSAYLHGQLDEEGTAAFERRLAQEPGLARRLDALGDALAELAAAGATAAPEGFENRLAARLAAERSTYSLDAVRARREARSRWLAGLSVAAGVVLAAVAGVQVLRAPDEGVDLARGGLEESAPQEAQLEAQTEALAAPDAHGEGEALSQDDTATMDAPAGDPGPSARRDTPDGAIQEDAPHGTGTDGGSGGVAADSAQANGGGVVIADDGLAMDDDKTLTAHFRGRPEADAVRGMSRTQAQEVAARHADEVRAAAPFASGVRPDACLDVIEERADDPRPVVRVERVRYRDAEAVVYLVGALERGSDAIDRFELYVTGPEDCGVRRFLAWS